MGGAGVAARRLHLALLDKGVDSRLLTFVKLGPDIPHHRVWQASTGRLKKLSHRLRSYIKRAFPFMRNDLRQYYLRGQKKGFEHFSFPYSENTIESDTWIKEADIIHLHWVADGMIDFVTFFKEVRKPIVWTLHDMNPFTGGCHHSDGCVEFTKDCVNCDQVKGTVDEYIAMRNLSYKVKSFQENKPDITIITPSAWLKNLSVQSKLFRSFPHHVIPNLSNEKSFLPGDKKELRRLLNVTEDAFVLLFVANDVDNPRKGIKLLLRAASQCSVKNLVLATAGREIDPADVTVPTRQFGFITSEEKMRELYAMADVFVLPSLAENFPNTIIEALLCGTPVVAHKVGGIPEQVNEKNGILVSPGNVHELAQAIENISVTTFSSTMIRQDALTHYSGQEIVEKHIDLYRRLKGKL
jgi:glycosyltransferase involved in cell wall biosynthesis